MLSIERWRWFCLVSGIIGVVVFGMVLLAIQTQRDAVETHLQRVVVIEVEQQVRLVLEAEASAGTAKLALRKLAAKYQSQAAMLENNLADNVPTIVAGLLGERCKASCQTRANLSGIIASAMTERAAQLKIGETTLQGFVVERYDRTVQNLIADVSIFSLTNLIAFASLLLLAAFKGKAARHLAPFMVMLVVVVGLATYFYVFGQDWFATIVFNDFIGWGYAVWIGIIYAFMFDIAFLHGTVTTSVLNAAGGALSPC